ncbi:MAG TPA: SGNH/GDSL hydrolase family protein [Burkholderiales bacterium]|nr:SGNH/GDSL hydrolase family protein [Burkholderiales bacterium]
MLEGVSRVYLRNHFPDVFTLPDPEKGSLGVYNVSHWEFDKDFGYIYPPGRTIDQVNISDGRVVSCDRISVINKFGNIGPVAGDWASAQLKIAVFGDSWTAFHQNGKTWPHFLHEILEKRLGKSVAVMNFGRDGYGVLQMFDLAAAKIPEWRPDIAVFAFISDDLTRARFWRTVIGEGDNQRVLTTIDPIAVPSEDRATDTYLLMASATYAWCKKMLTAKEPDDVLRRLVDKRRQLLLRPSRQLLIASVWDFSHSFVMDALLRDETFWTIRRRTPAGMNPRTELRRYSDDPLFLQDLAKIKESGTDWTLFHLAISSEIKANREYRLKRQGIALLESLERVTEKKVLRTTDYVKMPVEQPERMKVTPDNEHPSLWGMNLYAAAIAEALMRGGSLERRKVAPQ